MPRPERPHRILIVDDKLEMAETLADGLEDLGFAARAVGSSKEAAALLEQPGVELLVTDLRMPQLDGLGLLAVSKQSDPDRPVIVMTAFGAIDSAVESIRQGAYHYLTKPFKLEELAIFVERALAERALRSETVTLKKRLGERFSLRGLLGASPAMQKIFGIVERVAPTDAPVLLTGETGTGKGAIARAIHGESGRAGKPFVAVNCAALPDQLLESELFGHVKGAFTGAVADKTGLFVEADGGTLFLDEIAEMSPALQAKLLHVFESHSVRPVGANRERAVNVRLLAATHRDLRQRVADGQFREDLLYRLDVVPIHVPALRERKEDLPLFLDQALAQARGRHPASKVERFSREALARLLDHPWPGNVRELQHTVERLVLLGEGPAIGESELPPAILAAERGAGPAFRGEVIPIRELQRRYARWAFEEMKGHRTRTAEKLGVDLKTLARWLSDEAAAAPEPP